MFNDQNSCIQLMLFNNRGKMGLIYFLIENINKNKESKKSVLKNRWHFEWVDFIHQFIIVCLYGSLVCIVYKKTQTRHGICSASNMLCIPHIHRRKTKPNKGTARVYMSIRSMYTSEHVLHMHVYTFEANNNDVNFAQGNHVVVPRR